MLYLFDLPTWAPLFQVSFGKELGGGVFLVLDERDYDEVCEV